MRFVRLFILCALALSIPSFLKKDFKVPPVYESIPPYTPEWDMGGPSDTITSILRQKYTYFANGNQSTVFLSEDGQYVLKLFKYSRSRFPIIHNVKNYFKKKPKMDLLTKITKTLNGAHLACTEAKEFTQTVYGHLNLTKGLLPHTRFQIRSQTFELPLDRYRFVIQKKVTSFKEALLSAKGHPDRMKQLLESFTQLIQNRSSLDIRNSDPNLAPNFGFLGTKAVELDFGNYHKIPTHTDKKVEEFENLMNRFEEWMRKNAPEYGEYLKHLRLNARSSYDTLQ